MRLGPIIIRKCIECSGLMKETTVRICNTYGATFFIKEKPVSSGNRFVRSWTDGKCEAVFCPDYPWLVKCPHCHTLIWIDEQEEIDIIDRFSDGWPYKDAKPYSVPELQDYFDELKTGNLGSKKEQYIRMRAWWAGNDKRRGTDIKEDLSDDERENLQALDQMMSVSDDKDRIMKAEIRRELGQFEDAEAILEEPFVDDLSGDVSIVRELIRNREQFVTEMKFND